MSRVDRRPLDMLLGGPQKISRRLYIPLNKALKRLLSRTALPAARRTRSTCRRYFATMSCGLRRELVHRGQVTTISRKSRAGHCTGLARPCPFTLRLPQHQPLTIAATCGRLPKTRPLCRRRPTQRPKRALGSSVVENEGLHSPNHPGLLGLLAFVVIG